ncbi:MFS transporter [Kineosporia rhizophila]|nr:MFS transporter [Kineosporia rhizophila]
MASSFGFAAFATASGLFFVRFIDLTPNLVGIGLAVAGVVGLGSPLLFGRLSDVLDVRTLALWLFVFEAALVACYAFTSTSWMFIVVVTAVTFVDRGTWVARSVLTVRVVAAEQRVRFRAQQQVVFNAGAAGGSLTAAVPLQLDTRAGYLGLLALYVLCYAVAALCLAAIPPAGGPQQARPQGWQALRDPAYIASALLSGLLLLHHSLLIIAVPLWVARSTDAPTFTVGLLIALNTVIAVLLQVRLSAGSETTLGAAKAGRSGAFVLVPACILLGLAGFGNTLWAVTTLAAGVVLLTLGELWTVSSRWGLGYALAPDALMGEYQGIYNLGTSVEGVLGPLIATYIVVGWGFSGWLVVAGIFLALGLLVGPTTRWGERTRTEPDVARLA